MKRSLIWGAAGAIGLALATPALAQDHDRGERGDARARPAQAARPAAAERPAPAPQAGARGGYTGYARYERQFPGGVRSVQAGALPGAATRGRPEGAAGGGFGERGSGVNREREAGGRDPRFGGGSRQAGPFGGGVTTVAPERGGADARGDRGGLPTAAYRPSVDARTGYGGRANSGGRAGYDRGALRDGGGYASRGGYAERGEYAGRGGYVGRSGYARDGQRPGGRGDFSYRGRSYGRFRAQPFRFPRGYAYRAYRRGQYLPRVFLYDSYFLNDYAAFYLAPPPAPDSRWVRYGPDALLVDIATGEVEDVAYGVFDDGQAYGQAYGGAYGDQQGYDDGYGSAYGDPAGDQGGYDDEPYGGPQR